jgi:phosphate transport system permease protein
VGAASYIGFTPGGIEAIGDLFRNPSALFEVPFDRYTCMPMQIYSWVSLIKKEYQNVAAAGIVVLLAVLLLMNAAAVYIRMRFQKKIQW